MRLDGRCRSDVRTPYTKLFLEDETTGTKDERAGSLFYCVWRDKRAPSHSAQPEPAPSRVAQPESAPYRRLEGGSPS